MLPLNFSLGLGFLLLWCVSAIASDSNEISPQVALKKRKEGAGGARRELLEKTAMHASFDNDPQSMYDLFLSYFNTVPRHSPDTSRRVKKEARDTLFDPYRELEFAPDTSKQFLNLRTGEAFTLKEDGSHLPLDTVAGRQKREAEEEAVLRVPLATLLQWRRVLKEHREAIPRVKKSLQLL